MSGSTAKEPARMEQRTQPVASARGETFWQPMSARRDDMERMIETFWRGFGPPGLLRRALADRPGAARPDLPFGQAVPAVDVVENDQEYRITAELPGLDPADVEVGLTDDVLTIRGQKKAEREEKSENFCLSERRFGSFQRSFQLPAGVDRARIDAKFDKGVLTVVLPKSAEAQLQQKKIEVRTGS